MVDIIFNFFLKALVENLDQGFLSLVKFSRDPFKLPYIVSGGSGLLEISKLSSSFFMLIGVSEGTKESVLKGFVIQKDVDNVYTGFSAML